MGEHEIVESVIDERTQVVRCKCGRSAMFARRRNIVTGAVLDRARGRFEFVCTGEAITLRAALVRVLQGGKA